MEDAIYFLKKTSVHHVAETRLNESLLCAWLVMEKNQTGESNAFLSLSSCCVLCMLLISDIMIATTPGGGFYYYPQTRILRLKAER